ncbi:MAG: roadblock/LC7 domain-containing protein [Alphaproteobacteria bacterium]|nr:roadblock/LC7 domain-containing protein [Alphaproteobacteria bacterium]
MPPVEDHPLKHALTIMADYDALLTRAVEKLPDPSEPARTALYSRTRASLVAQLRSTRPPEDMEDEIRLLDEAINRFETRFRTMAHAKPTPPALERSPATSNLMRSDSWLGDLLSRASADDEPEILARPRVTALPDLIPPMPVPVPLPVSKVVPPMLAPVPQPMNASVTVALKELREKTIQAARGRPQQPGPERTSMPPSPPFQASREPQRGSRDHQERPPTRSDELYRALRKLQNDSPGVEASALISEDGLMIASALSSDMEESRVAGMTATLLNLGSRAAVELSRGNVREVIVRGEHGYAILINAGRGALLLALTNESAKLGLVFFDMREAVRSLTKIL